MGVTSQLIRVAKILYSTEDKLAKFSYTLLGHSTLGKANPWEGVLTSFYGGKSPPDIYRCPHYTHNI